MEGDKPAQVYTWNGAHRRGDMRIHRANKRDMAEARNALTLPENRRKARLARYAEEARKVRATAA